MADKVKKEEMTEFTMGEFMSPLYDVVSNETEYSTAINNDSNYEYLECNSKQSGNSDADAEYSVLACNNRQSVPMGNSETDAEYSVLARSREKVSRQKPTPEGAACNNKQSVLLGNIDLDAKFSVLAKEKVMSNRQSLPEGSAGNSIHTACNRPTNHIAAKRESEDVSCKRFICILVTITLVTAITLVCLTAVFVELAKLKTLSASSQQTSSSQQISQLQQNVMTIHKEIIELIAENNVTQSIAILQLDQQLSSLYNQTQILSYGDMYNMLQQQLTTLHNQQNDSDMVVQQQLTTLNNQMQQLNDSNTMLQQQLTTLNNQTQQLGDSNTMLQQQLTTLNNQTQQLGDSNTMLQQQLHNQTQQLNDSNIVLQQLLDTALFAGQLSIYPAVSCAALLPSSPSGYYWVRASNGSAVSVYCNMTLSCGGVTGGWMRVAELDMTNSSHQCPSGLMERNDSANIRTCVRDREPAGCSSVELSTANNQYSKVCGRITAYQVGRPNQFRSAMEVIDSHYVDGISLTHGSQRQHIWTFAAARDEDQTCNCSGTEGDSPPEFVGQDYFCEAGSVQLEDTSEGKLLPDDPLWDGAGCSKTGNTCCSFNNPPWFYKQLPSSAQPTTDNIEMRVCRNRGNDNEDIAIEIVEIYIQ